MVDTSVNLCGIKLDNPVMPSSGTFGYGNEFSYIYDINCLGTLVLKGTTIMPRTGNPTPRIAECESGVLASVGLQNPGAKAVLEKEIPLLKNRFKKPFIANISGFSEQDYIDALNTLKAENNIGWFEINVSCPNVKSGLAFGSSTEGIEKIVKAVRPVTDKPLIIKLSPNVTDIAKIAKVCEECGADGLTVANTFLGMRIDLKTKKPILPNKFGGFSGPAIKPIVLRQVYQVYEAVNIPIIAVGGIKNAEDVIEYMLAGATAVGIGCENLREPFVCKNIIDSLHFTMQKHGIECLNKITGLAHT